MAKKAKRKFCSDRVKKKKSASQNPFEVRFNHQKREVLGRKTKHDRGLPGISRSKATEKRKKTLLKEYQDRFKANRFVDRRIGEYDPKLTLDDKMAARFVAERKPSMKNTMYNLEEEEELTHYGQSLATVEKFDDPATDSDEDDDKLNAEFVKTAHFGGGFLSKKEEEDGSKARSREDLIDELIARTKERRREARAAKEETCELTERLDGEWGETMALLTSRTAKGQSAIQEEEEADDYDRVVRELKFEMRARPTDRLKTPEEMAKENKEALEELEAKRVLRMKGLAPQEETVPRSTSDDLYSGLDVGRVRGTDSEVLRYDNEGKLVRPVTVQFEGDQGNREVSATEDLSGLFCSESSLERVQRIRLDLKKRKAEMDDARSEIPYLLEVPRNYDSFVETVGDRSAEEQATVVDRIIKCNHPSLHEDNGDKLQVLFAILLQHVSESLDAVDALVPFLYDLARFNPDACARYLRAAVLRKQRDFSKSCSSPGLDTLVFLKLVALLYPTSDFHHCTVTPSMLFMSQILIRCSVETRKGVACGLFLCNLFLEYVQLSKRYVPEVVRFLCRVLFAGLSEAEREELRPRLASKMTGGAATLRVRSRLEILESGKLSLLEAGKDEPMTDLFRFSALRVGLELLREFAVLYDDLQSHASIFADAQKMVDAMAVATDLAPALKDRVLELKTCLSKPRALDVLAQESRKRDSSFKFHDPVFEERFDGRKRRKGDRVFHEKQKLVGKYKKELKGAVREIRMDNRFLARHRLQEARERDDERKSKLKRLYRDLADQEHDVKALKRKKAHEK